ncbi:MAG: hypothetical protein E6Q83_07800 [Thiothrix sp.]|nr:MAG: hypothetical protein E6Q83_07800 [Thiothrix sp.]
MNLSNRSLLWLNIGSFILMIVLNTAGSFGWLNDRTVAEISDRYATLLTPAGYAFVIWTLIYLLLIGFLWYQWKAHREGQNGDSLEPAGIWFALSNLFNGLWIVAWLNDFIGVAMLLMIGLLVSLFQLVMRLRLEVWDAPVRIIMFVWWPICIYIGWITLAAPVNLAAWLKSVFDTPPFFSGEFWAIISLACLTTVYIVWTQWRNMREASLVAVWGLVAIAVQQWSTSWVVGLFALACSALLLAVATAHALRNKATWPQNKLKRGEF